MLTGCRAQILLPVVSAPSNPKFSTIIYHVPTVTVVLFVRMETEPPVEGEWSVVQPPEVALLVLVCQSDPGVTVKTIYRLGSVIIRDNVNNITIE